MPVRPSWRALWTLVVAVLLLECTVRVALWLPGMDRRIARFTDGDLGRELVAYAHRGSSLPDQGIVDDPTLGWVPTPGAFSANAQGYRSAIDTPPGPASRPRLVLLGDSFVWGFGVERDESLGEQLQSRLPAYEVVNLGVPGYGHDQAILRFEQNARALSAQRVVLVAVEADVARNARCVHGAHKPCFQRDGRGALVPRRAPVPSTAAVSWRVWLRPRTVDLARLWLQRWRGGEDVDADALTRAWLDRFVETAQAAGAEPLVVVVPQPSTVDRLRGVGLHPEAGDDAHSLLVSWCEAHATRCRDLTEAINARVVDPMAFRRGMHWSPSGTALVAEALAAALDPQESGL